jgi:NADH dehydrogenase/NADH:ubiquinone oxidoreductase subunit G
VETFISLGVKDFTWIVDEALTKEKEPYDGILKHRDLTPNAMGFEIVLKTIGQSWLSQAQAKEKLKANAFDRVFALGVEGYEMPGLSDILLDTPSSTKVALHTTSQNPFFEKCDWILPNVSSFEKSGTMINAQGRIQKLQASVPKQFLSRDCHQLVWGLSQKGDRKPVSLLRFQDSFKRVIGPKLLGKDQLDWRHYQGGELIK